MLLDSLNLVSKFALQTPEDGEEERIEDIENFVIMFVNSHFEIETDEFSHVSMSVGVFSSENGSDFVDSFHVSCDTHLLGQLRTLGEESGSFIVSSVTR